MKKLHFIVACVVCSLSLSAQTNTGLLQITLHKNLLPAVCNLSNDSNGVYLHSGLGYTSSTAAWEAIVGNWGLKDGIGAMTHVDDSTYTLCMNIVSYYTTLASPDSLQGGQGLGPLPAGGTPYNIGLVFRVAGPCPPDVNGKPQCGFAGGIGKDPNCDDIFIEDLPMSQGAGSPYVVDYTGDPYNAVEVAYVASCATTAGVQDISYQLIHDIKVSPNPFSDQVTIAFNMVPDATPVHAEIYDVMGRMVADLSKSIGGGYNTITWNATGLDGRELAIGTYMLKVSNGTQTLTKKLIKR
jgi:hypothetical protein